MTQTVGTTPNQARRCPNCGSRVAQEAETCYFCGYDLTMAPPARRQFTWLDLLLVVGLLLLVVLWWQMGSRSDGPDVSAETVINTPQPVDPQQTEVPVAIVATVTPLPENQATPGPLVVVHTVQSGETLSSIAIQYSVTVEDIQQMNGLQDALIRAGDELIIPVPQVISENNIQAGLPTIFRYTVQPGDTVVSIAVRFGATVEGILDANGISSSDFIRPDQILRIPVEVPSTVAFSSESARNAPGATTTGVNTPTSYGAPRLLEPIDESALPRSEEVIFRWISVDLLAPNEWYVLRIWPVEGSVGLLPAVWTKATSHRLHPDAVPVVSAAMNYGWQITVVRILPDQGEGRGIQAASTPSEVRNFTWR